MSIRVLLVQSEVQSAQTLARFFEDRGDEIWIADQVEQGLSLLATWHPDLVLLDLHFPGNDWLTLLRQAHQAVPPIKTILTNKYPDLHRELQASDHGTNVFLRQPYTQHWVDAAVRRAFDANESAAAQAKTNQLPRVRLPMRIKITAPYLILAVLFALASAYVITRIVLESVQDRYLNQLIETGRQAEDWMVREEDRLLGSERMLANSQGLVKAILDQDAEAVRSITFPVVVTSGEDAVEIVDLQGITLLSIHHKEGGGAADYDFSRGDPIFGQQVFSRAILLGQTDTIGDKYAGFVQASWGNYFYVGGPVYDENNQVIGAVLVGKSLLALARQAAQDSLADISFYDFNGNVVGSTLFITQPSAPLTATQIDQVLQNPAVASLSRTITLSSGIYTEILGPWQARNQQAFGVMGSTLPQNYLVRTSNGVQIEVFLLIAGAIIFVVLVGLFLASLITRPLSRLVRASNEVAQGNLEIKVDSGGNDEMAVLAQSFNYMVAGLQEGSVYRDLLGRTVSPEVRDQLRQTFTSGGIRLEGQEAVTSVLMTDIRAFTTLSETTEPATVLTWLNEYFGRLVPIIQLYGGVVNKFDGDAMLAFFGILPRRLSPMNGALAACKAALDMLKVIDQLNSEREARGDPPLITGIGINTGVVIAGGLGTSDRLHYTIIGDTVNTTQRLESLTRQLFSTTGVLIGNSTFQALGDCVGDFCLTPAGMHAVKGKAEQIEVFRLAPKLEAPAGSRA
jgi:class 3 adenylate cyclase/CheY-like chemotaxis protein